MAVALLAEVNPFLQQIHPVLKKLLKNLRKGFNKTDFVPSSETDCLWCELLVAKQLLAKCCRALDYVKDWDLPRMIDCFLDAEITGVMYLIPFISRHVPCYFNLIQHQSLTQGRAWFPVCSFIRPRRSGPGELKLRLTLSSRPIRQASGLIFRVLFNGWEPFRVEGASAMRVKAVSAMWIMRIC